MAINTDPRRDPRAYETRRNEGSNAAIWVVLALILLGLVIWFAYETSTSVPETTGPGITQPETPETTPPPNP